MTDMTAIDITVDELVMPTAVLISDVNTLFPDVVGIVGDVIDVTVTPDVFAPDVIGISTGIVGPPGPPGPTGPAGPNPMVGGGQITVGTVAPPSPAVNDVWIDTS